MKKYQKKQPGRLHSETLELLQNRPRWLTLAEISEATGVELGWLRALSRGPSIISDPSVNRIEPLHEFLTQKLV